MTLNNLKGSYVAIIIILLVTIFQYTGVAADVPPEQQGEVSYLLNAIKTSGCIMERNGEQGTGEMAHDHIVFKYDYYREDIQSTEDFIRLAATKSVLSGEYYMIYCENQAGIRLADWLLRELESYRRQDRIQ